MSITNKNEMLFLDIINDAIEVRGVSYTLYETTEMTVDFKDGTRPHRDFKFMGEFILNKGTQIKYEDNLYLIEDGYVFMGRTFIEVELLKIGGR